ncbi:hypothetical protein [Nitrosomonas sp. Nm33]|uniref:hypothetical protein n=1 Tax=Nitrosomonas sp. Nm33 TaxID=133724 RepID=UPI000898174D|nr:hypothetical protein [Nitrosomonas sp. Nm33]SDY51632.1 hypothetical protein SAMN05421755_10274 [Nitrosomonas sp. Nm33]
MKLQKLVSLFLVLTILLFTSLNVMATCGSQVQTLVTQPPYSNLAAVLTDTEKVKLTNLLKAVKDDATYNKLLTEANAVAAMIANGRMMIALPDGTVVVDTAKGANNTFANFKVKAINENHNTRISILDAQLHDCGIGLEQKFSTTDGTKEVYFAKRLGAYLNSAGTARLSQKI